MAKRKQEEDQKPIKLADNLFWLGKDQVSWISKDVNKDEEAGEAAGDTIVDEEQIGLRVAVCGGKWDAAKWAAEIQGRVDGVDGIAQEDPSSSAEVQEDNADFLLPSSLERLYQHRAFQAKSLVPASSQAGTVQAEPQTLAAARAKLQAEQAGSTSSTTSKEPSIDLLLLPTWPAGVSLFSKAFPPSGAPEEARMWGLPPVAEVMRRAKPRYGFAIAPEADKVSAQPTPENGSETALSPAWQENGVFWEREPYTSAIDARPAQRGGSGSNAVPVKIATRTTRFISLANFANAKKVRWFVALNLLVGAAANAPPAQPVKGITQSPFGGDIRALPTSVTNGNAEKKRKVDEAVSEGDGLQSNVNFRWQQGGQKKQRRAEGAPRDDDAPPPEGYVCVVCGSKEHYVRLCPHKQQQQQQRRDARNKSGAVNLGLPNRPEGAEEALGPMHRREPVQMVGPKDCWFCLSNEGCAKHLVVAIGEESYLALPKGQLPPSSSEASPVPGGGHVLIIPISHVPSVQSLDDAAAKDRLAEEIEQYLSALSQCYEAHGCILVAWSIVKLSNTRAGHMQVQVVPVPQARILAAGGDAQDFETYLRSEASQRGYKLEEVTDGPKAKRIGSAGPDAEYFQLHIFPSSNIAQRIVYNLDLKTTPANRGIRFDYQFPRIVLASYLGVPDRADWRKCARSEKVEEVETRTFRDAFAEWMPSFGEDEEDSDDDDEE
jgi:hypothetical protein